MSSNFGKRTPCPVTKDEFLAKAPKLVITVRLHGSSDAIAELVLDPRTFSSGSYGWYATEKVEVPVNGCRPKVQAGLNLTLVNSAPPK
jgi:hypothetical protein